MCRVLSREPGGPWANGCPILLHRLFPHSGKEPGYEHVKGPAEGWVRPCPETRIDKEKLSSQLNLECNSGLPFCASIRACVVAETLAGQTTVGRGSGVL